MSGVVKIIFGDGDSDITTSLNNIFTIGQINSVSVEGMVKDAKAGNGKDKIERLDWYAHGTDTYIGAGYDTISDMVPKTHMPKLAKLRNKFASDSYVRLFVCKAGQCCEALSEMAKTLGVNIYACTGDVRPIAYGTPFVVSGELVVARPSGEVKSGRGVDNVFYYSETDA